MVSELKIAKLDLGLIQPAIEYVEITEHNVEKRFKQIFDMTLYGSAACKLFLRVQKQIEETELVEFNIKYAGAGATVLQVFNNAVANKTEVNKWKVFTRIIESSCRRTSASPEEELKRLKKERHESWNDFVDRYVHTAADSTAEATRHTKILYQKLPAKYRQAVCDLAYDCSLHSMVNRIRNISYWEGDDAKPDADVMDIDAVQEIPEYRAETPAKVVNNGRINYDAINSPGRVMVGAREICKNSRKEAWNLFRYLQRLLDQDQPQNRRQNRRPQQNRGPHRTYKTTPETCETDEGPSQLGEITEDFEEASEQSFPVNVVKTSKAQKGVMKLPITVTSHLGYQRKVEGLVDTGAERSVISLTLVKELGLKIRKDNSKLIFANGDSSSVTGKCTLKFKTTNTKTGQLKVDCLILPKPGYELLIGMDFLKSEDISINPSSHTLTMNRATVKCFSARNVSKMSIRNSVVEETIGTFTEKATHLPVVKDNKITFPLNRSIVLGPKEIKMIKYPAVLTQKLTYKKAATITPNFSVHVGSQLKDFTVLSLTNHKDEPVRLTPRTTIFEVPLLQSQEPTISLQDGTKVTLKAPLKRQPFHARQ